MTEPTRRKTIGVVGAAFLGLGTFGALTTAELEQFGDTALAHAAEPALGEAGFTMMAIAALLATAPSVNASLFAAGNITALPVVSTIVITLLAVALERVWARSRERAAAERVPALR
jgi:hypothetical protein